jgi:uncharacterized protein (DUF433 family)
MARKQPLVLKSLRIPEPLAAGIQASAASSGKGFSEVANELLDEALKMRRCPGTLYADGPTGRRARLAGTGIEVWEIIAAYRSAGSSLVRLARAYPWLAETQLRAALGYYAAYGEEIDALIARNERWTEERLRVEHPALATSRRRP